jgi:nitric oxide reductase subunit B
VIQFFGIGAIALGWFILGLKTGWSIEDNANEIEASIGKGS